MYLLGLGLCLLKLFLTLGQLVLILLQLSLGLRQLGLDLKDTEVTNERFLLFCCIFLPKCGATNVSPSLPLWCFYHLNLSEEFTAFNIYSDNTVFVD